MAFKHITLTFALLLAGWKLTEPPDGMTSPRDPAREIQVLRELVLAIISLFHWMSYLRIAKAMPIIVIFENLFWRWPSWAGVFAVIVWSSN